MPPLSFWTPGLGESQSTPRPSEKKLEKISNLAELWISMSETFVPAGIKVDGNIVKEDPEPGRHCLEDKDLVPMK